MEETHLEVVTFQTCCTVGGRPQHVTIGRRNGIRIALFGPAWTDGGPSEEPPIDWLDNPKYYVNLNQIERRTWRKLLSGQTIASIAKEEGVSRKAIYDRIEGNGKGQGGMIAKNFWVLLWWRVRQRLKYEELH